MIKITQVRDGGNHVTQSTLTLDAWVERMKEEVKTCPVTMFRSQLRHVLPGDHCEAADKLPKMMPAAEFRHLQHERLFLSTGQSPSSHWANPDTL